MKKNLVRLFACAVSAACLFSLAACSETASTSKTDSSAPASSAVSSQEESVPSSEASSESIASSSAVSDADASSTALSDDNLTSSGKFATIEDFVNSSIMQAQFETMKKQVEGDGDEGMTVDLTGEGNKLIYTFTYTELDDVDQETLSTVLEAGLDQEADTFEDVASSLKSAVEVENPVVVVTYKAPDGSELCSREFSPAE